MTLTDLEFAPAITLPASLALYRVQRFTSRPGDRKVGRIRLASPGILAGRFDLQSDLVGYFAEQPETAGYEALARREVRALHLPELAKRELMCLTLVRPLHLLDLRMHAQSWPVLQSLRFRHTQGLAAGALREGFEGIIYKSAQQHGTDCMAIFEPALRKLRHAWSERLVDPDTGNLHQLIDDLCRGAQMSVCP